MSAHSQGGSTFSGGADLPLPSTSDAIRDESTPAFLARLRAVYGDLEPLGDVLEALGIEVAA